MSGSFRDDAWLNSLLSRHWNDIVRMITRELDGHKADAEDLAQQTFITALNCGHKVPDDESEAAQWLYRTARNNVRNFRRSAGRHPEQLISLDEMQAIAGSAPGDLAEDVAGQVDVLNLVTSLRSKDRHLLQLLFIDGKATAEVAMLLGLTEPAVRQKLKRVRERLQKLIDRRNRHVIREAEQRVTKRHTTGDDHNG
jgi:RNA polymerase sigma-70 factor (ECF subfamily)